MNGNLVTLQCHISCFSTVARVILHRSLASPAAPAGVVQKIIVFRELQHGYLCLFLGITAPCLAKGEWRGIGLTVDLYRSPFFSRKCMISSLFHSIYSGGDESYERT